MTLLALSLARPDAQARADRSFSGQFILHTEAVANSGSAQATLATNRNFVLLRSATLAVSCERIKQMVWRELGLTQPWRSKIHVILYPATSPDDPITVVSERFTDGWQFRVEIPDLLDREKFVRAICQVLLLEIANRQSADRSAELPRWLIEGLTRQIFSSKELELILTPPQMTAVGLGMNSTMSEARRISPLTAAHQHLQNKLPLSFEQLSWPLDEDLAGDRALNFRYCAQLFVVRLLGLPDGPACLQKFLVELPAHLNWQIAFLRAYAQHFQRPLDVEKWWSLQTFHFTARDLDESWDLPESWQKLERLLVAEIQVRSATNDLPMRSQLSLQSVIRDWDRITQMEVLQPKVRELEMLILRVAPQVVVIADDYRSVLATYLRENKMLGAIPARTRKMPSKPNRTEETARLLDEIDVRRHSLAAPRFVDTERLLEAVRALETRK